MSLHVTGQEAASCVRFLEKAFSKWEREQSKHVALSASQAAKTKEQPQAKPSKRKSGTVQRVWTADEIAAIAKAIETKQTTRSLAAQLGISYGLVWQRRTQIEHALKLSLLRDATSSSEQRVDVPHTE
jgi:cation transport ATPase